MFTSEVNNHFAGIPGFGQSYGWSNPRHPAYLLVIHVARETALAQVGIAIEIFRRLYDARCDPFALQYQHDLMGCVLRGPTLNSVIDLFVVLDARSDLGES